MSLKFLSQVDLTVTSSVLKTDSNGVIVSAVAGTDYAAASHTHSATDITSGILATGRLSGTYNISITGNATTATSATAASSATTASNVNGSSGQLLRRDNRTIAPNEITSGYLQFGFTSFNNNNTAPWADYLHLRSYTDSSGGNDNLLVISKSTKSMRLYQQAWNSGTAYSTYVDFWTTGNFTSTNVTNWDTAYGWGDHGIAGYAPIASPTFTGSPRSVTPILSSNDTSIATTAYVKAQGYSTTTGTVTSVGMTVPTGLAISGSPVTTSGTLAVTFASGYSIPTNTAQTNWNTAYGWGNHAGLYASASHVHGRLYAESGTTSNYIALSSTNELELFNNSGVVQSLYLNYSGSSTSLYGPGGGMIWHANNDGASSGLDADLLDGQHGSYYAPLASPSFSGTPTAPTAGQATNNTQIATTAYVRTAISNLVDTAPGTLDTLNELAAALGDDPNFATTITTSIAGKAAIQGTPSDNQIAIWTSSSAIEGVDQVTWDGSTFRIEGTLEANEKSFNIPHPTKPNMRLIYGVLEGPEHAVYVRGRSSRPFFELPEEWIGLVDEDSITVQLTAVGKPAVLYVKKIMDNMVFVGSRAKEYEYFYFVQATRKDVKKLETERADV